MNRWKHFRSSNHKIAFLTPKKVAPKSRTFFHPLPPDQNVLILNYKKLGFQVDPLPPFRTMSLNILFFFKPYLMHYLCIFSTLSSPSTLSLFSFCSLSLIYFCSTLLYIYSLPALSSCTLSALSLPSLLSPFAPRSSGSQ